MDEKQTREAIRLHGVTNRHCQRAASARGDSEAAARHEAIATAAESGRLLAPTAHEAHIPDLLAAAQALGLVDGDVVANRAAQDAAEPLARQRIGQQALAPELPAGVPPFYE